MYIIQNFDAIDFSFANSNSQKVLENKEYDHLIVLQRYKVHPSQPVSGSDLDPVFSQKTLAELNLSNDIALRISEVIPMHVRE